MLLFTCNLFEFHTVCTAICFIWKRRYLPKINGKCGTNNKPYFTTVPLVPRLVPHYRIFRRPIFKHREGVA